MGVFKDLSGRVSNGWQSLGKSGRIVAGAVGASIIVSLILYFTVFGATKYVTMFTNLSLEDSASIVSKFDELKIQNYKLEDGGSTILVDEKKVDKLRLDLAMSGSLPNSGKGYEIFDNLGIMVTDEDRKIMYQRALEGELQRSIMSLQEINYARVHLVLAEDNLFNKETKPASASILLEIKETQSLSNDQIKGIISLVSGAVNNLSEESVKVLDANGNLLSERVSNDNEYDSTSAIMNKRDLENTYNRELENNLTNTLEKTFGTGKAVVDVSVKLDMDTKESVSKSYDGEPIVISEQKKYEGKATSDTGDNPTDTGSYISDGDIINDSNTESYETIRNFEVGETTTTTIKALGTVERISASVIIDGTLTDEKKESIKNIVMTAIGADETRGDIINVEGIPFDTSLKEAVKDDLEKELPQTGLMNEILKYISLPVLLGIFAAILLGIILITVMLLRGRRKKTREKEVEDIMLKETLPREERRSPDIKGQDIRSKDIIDEVIIDTGKVKIDFKDKINSYANENPKEAAELLKLWIIEGSEKDSEN
ncbi:flagellar basal-body MS-ring/collar protein FliF [Clostridium sediminicola]|uniref:flagellar basal-body MS-ring/collar protein FliF n=1 Tax=Clostridium sediminicola TaxID=3114879 RepID=UPI0031F24BB1